MYVLYDEFDGDGVFRSARDDYVCVLFCREREFLECRLDEVEVLV